MKLRLKHLIPTPTELVGGIFLTVIIILLANSKRLLNYYGLHSSDELIKSSAGNVVTEGLTAIDSFSATNGVVTFLIWAVVGIICFGIVEALGNAYHEIQLQKQVSSKNYVHPATFSKGKFWKGVALDTSTLVFGLAMLAACSLLFVLFVLPLGLAYSRVFLFDTSLQNAVYLLLALFVLCVGLFVIDIVVRFLLFRRRVVSFS